MLDNEYEMRAETIPRLSYPFVSKLSGVLSSAAVQTLPAHAFTHAERNNHYPLSFSLSIEETRIDSRRHNCNNENNKSALSLRSQTFILKTLQESPLHALDANHSMSTTLVDLVFLVLLAFAKKDVKTFRTPWPMHVKKTE